MIDRIKEIMELSGSSPAQFAGAIGINRSNLTHLFSGRNQPSLDLAKKILLAFPEVKTEWLIMGVGPMTKTDEQRIQSPIQSVSIEPDLFSQRENTEKTPIITHEIAEEAINKKIANSLNDKKVSNVIERELKNDEGTSKREPIFNSQKGKRIEKIVLFYADKSFEVYLNE